MTDPTQENTPIVSPSANTLTGGKASLFFIGFSLPFIVVGAGMLIHSIRLVGRSVPDVFSVLSCAISWVAGITFFTMGLIVLLIGLFGKKVKPGTVSPLAIRKRLMGILSPEEEWTAGRISSSSRGNVLVAWFKAAVSSILVGPLLYLSIRRGLMRGDQDFLWVGAAWLIPTILGLQAIFKTLRFRKYGTSLCEVQKRPTAASGEFRFLIHPLSAELPNGEADLVLRCERREMRGSGKGRRLSITGLWKEEQKATAQGLGLGIPGSFNIPQDIPEASKQYQEGVFWILEVRCSTPGIDYVEQFDLALKRQN